MSPSLPFRRNVLSMGGESGKAQLILDTLF